MTIAILKREAGQTIPRPFCRACSKDEAVELLESWTRHGATVRMECLDTERPIMAASGAEFFAFTE